MATTCLRCMSSKTKGEVTMAEKKKTTFVIRNGDNELMCLEGIKLLGIKCIMVAMFAHESEALEVLYEIEKVGLSPCPHIVREIGSSFVAERMMSRI